jgi:hypothetical protein
LRPKLRTVSDYCYYDWLHFLIKNLDLQPMAFRFCLLQQNLPDPSGTIHVLVIYLARLAARPYGRWSCGSPVRFQRTGSLKLDVDLRILGALSPLPENILLIQVTGTPQAPFSAKLSNSLFGYRWTLRPKAYYRPAVPILGVVVLLGYRRPPLRGRTPREVLIGMRPCLRTPCASAATSQPALHFRAGTRACVRRASGAGIPATGPPAPPARDRSLPVRAPPGKPHEPLGAVGLPFFRLGEARRSAAPLRPRDPPPLGF